MKVLFGLGHPAHLHLFRNVITSLSSKGIEYCVVISDKDILKTLLAEYNIPFRVITKRTQRQRLINKALKVFRSTLQLNRIISEEKPDLLIGCLTQLGLSAFLKRKPVLFFGEDDLRYTYLQMLTIAPFIKKWVAPDVTNTGVLTSKKLPYEGYQKLAYLHPAVFTKDTKQINNIIDTEDDYFLIRLVGLGAYHDHRVKGMSDTVLKRVIEILSPHGKIYITSENPIPDWLKPYELKTNPTQIHHVMAYAKLFLGDSQSMAVESAMLGVPSVRFNDFAGKISLLEELEHKYNLTFSIPTSKPEKLYSTLEELISSTDLRTIFQERRQKMLEDKINVNAFFSWLIENYPDSLEKLKKTPQLQNEFR